MSSDQNKYGVPHLIGGTNLPKDANPAIRGSVRREDPDANPAPHFTGLNGTTLNLDYSPTGAQAINFTSDDLDDAITTINAVDAANLEATDDNGYLRLRNLNGGSKNYLKIISGDAAPLLGFRIDPLPGSASFAGEISTSPAGSQTGQDNPHGTALVASDEDLSSSGINRAIIGALLHVERIAGDLDLETLVIKEVAVTVLDHPISGEKVFRLQDPALRIPIRGFGINVSNPAAGLLDSQLMMMEHTAGQSHEFIDLSDAAPFGRIAGVFYDDLTNTLDDTVTFAAWGTPDGKSIFSKAASADKHAATAITTIDGDIINVSGATFQALDCSPGDTVLLESATNNDPFNHDGEFIITEVFDEETIRVRPKSLFDRTFSSSETPRGLNQNLPGGTSYGTLKVLIGDFISANDLVFSILPTSLVNGIHSVRMLVGSRLQDTRLPLADAHKPSLAKSDRRMAELLRIHAVTATSFRHTTAAIDGGATAGSPDSLSADTLDNQLIELLGHINNLIAGQVTYAGGVAWADGTTNPATDLESQVDKMLTDLATGNGAAKIQATAAPIWADATNRPAETLADRVDGIISDLASTAAGAGTEKIGGSALPNFADGTANGASELSLQLDAIIQALATGAGSAKIAQPSSNNWADGTTNPAETLGARIDSIINDLGAGDGASKIAAVLGPAWHDGTTNPAETLGARINSIINDLVDAEGADRIGSDVIGSLLTAGSIRDQLVEVEAELVSLGAAPGDRKKTIAATGGAWEGVSGRFVTYQAEADAGADRFFLPIDLHAGDTIKSILYRVFGASSGSKGVELRSLDFSTGSVTLHDSDSFTTSGNVTGTLTMAPNVVVGDGGDDQVYWFGFDAGNDGDRFAGIVVLYTPAP